MFGFIFLPWPLQRTHSALRHPRHSAAHIRFPFLPRFSKQQRSGCDGHSKATNFKSHMYLITSCRNRIPTVAPRKASETRKAHLAGHEVLYRQCREGKHQDQTKARTRDMDPDSASAFKSSGTYASLGRVSVCETVRVCSFSPNHVLALGHLQSLLLRGGTHDSTI